MTLHHGDCLDVMAAMPAESVDAVVTDPPYDLTSTGARNGSPRLPGTGPFSRGFMGKAWDGTGIAFRSETWAEALRVAKPGAYLLAFGGTRTVHRMTVAIEDAGWVIRDMLVWAYASGFPKSRALLKPAWEPIVMARKPGPLRELAIDACRIGTDDAINLPGPNGGQGGPAWRGMEGRSDRQTGEYRQNAAGRWPANVILTDPIFDGDVPGVVGGGEAGGNAPASGPTWSGPSGSASRSPMAGMGDTEPNFYGDTGTYSRFFIIPKASRSEREPLLPSGIVPSVAGFRETFQDERPHTPPGYKYDPAPRRNTHPTVKPVALMRHLVRLVTPTGGTVLDPFLGSGTTALAAEQEGFDWIGIEREAEYVAIAEARLAGVQQGIGLPA